MPYIGNVLTSFAVETGNINDQAVTAPKLSATGGTDGQVLALDSNLNLEWVSDPAGQWVTSGTDLTYSEGDVGIGVASPTSILDVRDNQDGAAAEIKLFNLDQGNTTTQTAALVMTPDVRANGAEISVVKENADFSSSANKDVAITFAPVSNNTATEQIRIDSSGRMLVGSSTARSNFFNSTFSAGLQLEGTGTGRRAAIIGANGNASIILARQESGAVGGNTAPSNGHLIGSVSYQANDGAQFVVTADISAELDGNPGSNDMPGRLKFSTTADGAASPTERMRIDSSGRVLVGTNSNRSDSGLQVEGTTFATSRLSLAQNSTTGNAGATLKLIKSRGTSTGSFTSVSQNDRIGNVQFSGADGSGDITAATVEVFVDGTPGTNDMPGRLVFSTTADGAASPTERMRIDSSGRLLVGTTSGTDTFQVEGSAGVARIIGNRTDSLGPRLSLGKSRGSSAGSTTIVQSGDEIGQIMFKGADGTDVDSTGAAIIGLVDGTPGSNDMPGALTFLTTSDGNNSPTERLRIDNSGRLLIGITSSIAVAGAETALQVEGTTADTSRISVINRGNNTGGGGIQIAKSRGTQPHLVQDDDQVGGIFFAAGDANDFVSQPARIECFIDGAPSGSDTPGRLTFSTCPDQTDTPVERLRIDSSGRVLVGTTSNTAPGGFSAKIQTASTSFDGSISLRRDSNNTGAQTLAFGKSRGSLNGNTVVQSGDTLGTIDFYGADGTDLNTAAAQMLAAVDGTPGSNDMPGRLVFSTTADGASSPTERMRIDSSGNVGVGTTSNYDDSVLEVRKTAGGDGVAIRVTNNTTTDGSQSGIIFTNSTGDFTSAAIAHKRNDNALIFYNGQSAGGGGFANATERMRIDSSGRLSFGTTSAVNLNNASGASAREAKAYIFNTTSTTSERYNLGLIGGSANSTGCAVALNKTRSTTNTHTVVQSGDELGEIRFQGSDGTFFVEGAKIRCRVDGTPGSQDMPGRLEFYTTADGASSPTERLRIDSAGMVELRANQGTAETNIIRFTDTDTSVAAEQKFGQLQWFSNDASGGGPCVKGEIYVVARDTTPDGDMVFATHDGSGTSTAENIRLISSGGITFNGDTAETNALNDYEEGTWTPVFGSTSGAFTSITYSIQSGNYTRIGNRVYVECRLQITAHTLGTASGGLLVANLPYTVGSPTGIGGNVALSNFDIPTSVVNLAVEMRENAAQFYAGLYTRDNTTFGNITPANLKSGSTCEVRASAFYYTN